MLHGFKQWDQLQTSLLSFLRRAETTSKQRLQTLSGLDDGSEMDNLCFEQLSHTGAKHLRQLYYRKDVR